MVMLRPVKNSLLVLLPGVFIYPAVLSLPPDNGREFFSVIDKKAGASDEFNETACGSPGQA